MSRYKIPAPHTLPFDTCAEVAGYFESHWGLPLAPAWVVAGQLKTGGVSGELLKGQKSPHREVKT